MKDRRETWWHLLVIACFLAPLWLIRREMYDGIPIPFAIETGDFSGFREWMFGQRWFLTYWFYLGIGEICRSAGIDLVLLMRVILTACFMVQYFQYRWIFTHVFGLGGAAAALALVATLFPSLQIYASSLGPAMTVYLMAGLVGYRMVASDRGAAVTAAGAVLVVLSYQLNSMVTLLVGLQICAMILGARRRRDLAVLGTLLAAAVVFLVFRKLLTPPDGIYTSYNAIQWPTSADAIKRMLRVLLMFGTWAVIPLCAFLAALALQLATGGRPQWQEGLRSAWLWLVSARGSRLVAAWCVLLACATGPYLLAGKGPPLLTVTAWGNGITEQAIRQAYTSWIAPTFSVTSGRHALPLMICVALACWAMVAWAQRIAPSPERRRGLALWAGLAACVLPLTGLAWGAVWNRLSQQHAEIALVQGLKTLPAPPAGLVDVAYRPAADWLVHLPAGNMIAAQAWGGWRYFGLFHGFPSYRDELLWIYHSGFVELGGATSGALQKIQPIASVPANPCMSSYTAELPASKLLQVLAAGWAPENVVPARVTFTKAVCAAQDIPPNPYPGRAVTY